MDNRSVLWIAQYGPGAEHLVLRQEPDGWLADGTIVAASGAPFTAAYSIRCDTLWHVRELSVRAHLSDAAHALEFRSDGAGHWLDGTGAPLPAFEGCRDVDLSATPFTNTLPIRRLKLPVGASATIHVVYIAVPDLATSPVEQRYTHLAARPDGGSRYLYEGLDTGFRAEIEVDSGGLILDYPGIFKRAAG